MTKYTATFANGIVITRKTERGYGVAWRATWTRGDKACSKTGFAISADKVSAYQPKARHVFQGLSSDERAKRRAENAAYLVEIGYHVEVVPAVLAV
jgi:hypothetical protein